MKSKFLLPLLLSVGLVSAPAMAAEPVVGAIIGGGTGAVVGKSLGGQEGAVIGGILGAIAGIALSSDDHYDSRSYDSRRVVSHQPPPPPRAFPHRVNHKPSGPRFDNRFDKRPPAPPHHAKGFNAKPAFGHGGPGHRPNGHR